MTDNNDAPHPEAEPDPVREKLSLLARTIQAIGGTIFTLGVNLASVQKVEINTPMWSAAANLTTSEYIAARRLKRDWLNGSSAG
jgi:hypothetical protein